jgi:plastocyanin
MRRRATALLVAVAVAGGAVGAATATGAAATAVGVGAREFRFAIYRPVVPRGAVKLNLHDFGEDAHNVQVVGPKGYRSALSPDVLPGESLSFSVRLPRAGVYTLVCQKPGHLKKGMRAQLRVR